MMIWRALFLSLLVWNSVSASTRIVHADDRVEFNRDIRPILSDKCFFCHGPDANKREADLRLDDREAAIDGGAIAEGSPDDSELLRRVLSDDPDEIMPPPSSKLNPMTDTEIQTLTRWIEQGAKYQQHWAFVPIPGIETSARTIAERSASIDAIVKERLLQRKLTLQPSADRATLIRRLSFDLIGLPPTPEEAISFIKDPSTEAYEKLVDRLLASPHYGERMAVDWLDLSRYADSYGFQVDRPRDVWPWRDWVVRALNANLSFDQFATWQLAGDLIPGASDEQVLATAFNRLHQQESEGGSVEEEYRVEYVCDRVQTFATAFLGLTFECARCHDHKYDPISQQEYYQFFAMFQNIDEAGLYSFFTPSAPTPALAIADPSTKERSARLLAKVVEIEGQSETIRASCRDDFEKWVARPIAGEPDGIPNELARFSFDRLENQTLANSIDAQKPATLEGDNKLVSGMDGSAIEFTGDDPVNLTLGNFKREEPFSISLWLKTPDVKDRAVVFHRSRAWTDAASRGYELLIENGCLKWSLIHFWPGNAISIRTENTLPLDQWIHVVVTYDGSSRSSGLAIHVDGQLAPVQVVRNELTKEITGGGGDEIALGERFRDRGFKRGMIDDFRVFGRDLSRIEIQAVEQNLSVSEVKSSYGRSDQIDNHSDDQSDLLFDYYLATVDPSWASHQHDLQAARADYYKAQDGLNEVMVMREMKQPKPAYVLFRGEYGERREEVFAGTPAVLPPLPENAASNRLGLARWLFDPQHPLTARVTVNRIWQSIFGRGLVKTAEDFGSQGERPMYPEVLDSLAAGFIASGWDMKQLVKTIVMSDTYRQQSTADEATMADDPENQWLARGPRHRLSAEMIRDNSLAAAGLLELDLGGPPVNPYEMSESFKPETPSANGGVYRRSLYTNWRRTGPPPAMVAFDAPRRAVCTAKREQTDSPLQALILLNGVQYVEAARVLGESLYRDAQGDVTTMIENGFLRCLSRRPAARELEILRELYQEQLEHFQKQPADAKLFLKIGNHVQDASIPIPESAAATVLAQTLLNHDACVVKR
jgi:hypothetical protein